MSSPGARTGSKTVRLDVDGEHVCASPAVSRPRSGRSIASAASAVTIARRAGASKHDASLPHREIVTQAIDDMITIALDAAAGPL